MFGIIVGLGSSIDYNYRLLYNYVMQYIKPKQKQRPSWLGKPHWFRTQVPCTSVCAIPGWHIDGGLFQRFESRAGTVRTRAP